MSAPDSPAQHVAAIPGVTSAVVTDGRMLVGVEPGLDATTVALRAAIVLNALGAGLTVEVIGGRRTPSPAPLPVRWAGLSMTNMARVACAAVLAGSAGLAAVSNVAGSVSTPRFVASPALRHHRGSVPPVVLGPSGGALPIAPALSGEGSVVTNGGGASVAPGAKPAAGAPREVTPDVVVLVSIRHTPPPAVAVPAPATPATPAPTKPAPAPTTTSPVVPATTPPSTTSPTPRPTVPVVTVPQVVVAGNKPPVVAPVPPVTPPTVTPPVTSGDGSDHGDGSEHGHGSEHGTKDGHGDDGSHAHEADGSDHHSIPAVTTPARDGSGEVVDDHARRLPSS